MNFYDFTTYLISFTSVVYGAFFGAIANKIISERDKSRWIIAFYIFGFIAIILPIAMLIFYWDEVNQSNLNWVLIVISIIGGIMILIFTKLSLDVKNIFSANDLDPLINKFTSIADRSEIKLFGGDLNFFGDSVKQIDLNSQYAALKSIHFNKVLILCEEPKQKDVTTRLRYGKILTEISNVELRFYDPDEADLSVRGRILKVNGVNKLLMFKKISSGTYKTIETDTANSYGALYDHIWDLVWSLAISPSSSDIDSYKSLYPRS